MEKEETAKKLEKFACLAKTEQCFDWENGDRVIRMFRVPVGNAFLIHGMFESTIVTRQRQYASL